MKMSDTFRLPLKSEQGGVMPYLKDDIGLVIFVGDDRNVDATVKAVNNHDELVNALRGMIECYGGMLADESKKDYALDRAQEILSKLEG